MEDREELSYGAESSVGKDEKERELQQRILDSPSLLPGFEAPLAVAAEVPVRRAGSADVVVVDAAGQIAIVECKRARNPEIRRWVVGQLLEYAACLWKCEYEDLERTFAARGTMLTERFEHLAEWDEQSFRRAVSGNLARGDFKLFIAVDEMTEQLKGRLQRTVALLNGRLPDEMQFLAVALPRGGATEIYGADPESIPRLEPRLKADRWTLLEETGDPEARAAAEGLLAWAEANHLTVRCSRRERDGLETGAIRTPDGDVLFRIKDHREVRVSFQALRRRWEEERIGRLVDALTGIDLRFRIDPKSRGERPTAPLSSLAEETKREDFLALMDEVLMALGQEQA